jgi:hypothetical protein
MGLKARPWALLPPSFPSLIVVDFSGPFEEFRGKRFALLWRGNRDGYGYGHGHWPSLALIRDRVIPESSMPPQIHHSTTSPAPEVALFTLLGQREIQSYSLSIDRRWNSCDF